MLIALALQTADLPPAPPVARDAFADRAWAHFSRAPLLQHSSETVDIVFEQPVAPARVTTYTMRLTRRRIGQPLSILWADSRKCPAMRGILQTMRSLPLPHALVWELERGSLYAPTLDGIAYRLWSGAVFVNGRQGQLDLGSNVGTPLAAWVDRSLAALARCWSPVEPSERR